MLNEATESRTLTLIRFEHAAGAAFGCVSEDESGRATRFVSAPTAIAFATLATAVAATITYLI